MSIKYLEKLKSIYVISNYVFFPISDLLNMLFHQGLDVWR